MIIEGRLGVLFYDLRAGCVIHEVGGREGWDFVLELLNRTIDRLIHPLTIGKAAIILR